MLRNALAVTQVNFQSRGTSEFGSTAGRSMNDTTSKRGENESPSACS